MHVLGAMLPEDVDGALLMLGIRRAHPQQQAAALQLGLQPGCVLRAQEARQHGAECSAAAPPATIAPISAIVAVPPDATIAPMEAMAPT